MRRTVTIIGVAAALLAATNVEAGIELDTKNITVGDEVTVTATKNKTPLANQPFKVTYFPNSEIKQVVKAGRTDEAGVVRFQPAHAGLASLAVGDQSKTVSVRFASMPPGALIVFLIAGALLFGGIALGVSKLR